MGFRLPARAREKNKTLEGARHPPVRVRTQTGGRRVAPTGKNEKWWRRRESNPRPQALYRSVLHA